MLIQLLLVSTGGYWYLQRRKQRTIQHKLEPIARKEESTRRSATSFSTVHLLEDIKNALLVDGRQQLQMSLDPKLRESIEEEHRKKRRIFLFSSGAIGLALLSSVYPSFFVLGSMGAIYLSRHLLQLLREDFKGGRYLTVPLIATVSMAGLIITGHLVLATAMGLLGSFFAAILARVENKSNEQLTQVFTGHADNVWVLKDDVEIQISFHDIQPNDIIVVNSGEVIPVDGVVHSGMGEVDQHILTGESQPIEKLVGAPVFASTLLLSGSLLIQVETSGELTVAAKIGQILNQTQSYSKTLMVRGRELANRYVPVTLGISAFTFFVLGSQPALAVTWAALGATMEGLGPLSILSYLQILSQNAILVKDGRIFESLRQVDTVVFDKTGTLTLEQPTVGNIHVIDGFDTISVLRYAAAAEYRQPHPTAKAIQAKAIEEQLDLPGLDDASYEVGYGIKAKIDKKVIRVGSARFLEREGIELPETVRTIQLQAERDSYSLIYVAIGQQLAGILEMQPTLRPEAKRVVRYLKQRGIELYIISGDHEAPTRNMAKILDIEHYVAETLPENKATLVKQLREEGRFVCFIGDGINDAIALKSAQVSVSLKGASSAATDTAQIIFMDGTLSRLEQLFQLVDEFEGTMEKNMAISMIPGIITISGVYLLRFCVATGMGLFYSGMIAGVGNALWPLVKHQNTTANQQGERHD
ncbi:MAG: hypothetical protein DRR16_07200 [Candidatus Parabeggiatoa sp. nov. 3]|nr:MAG: hypothetical protein DRR00_00975 [Gammaproteobacteria bacterium]RKZ66486.1 MAG: hypothetical protein DRQ99_09620 [Gammaproteobacteria bacterium]RKZ87491.1 MAG: hypothetical protein DRR16_07200 [Gammaproteobacteria bacterium]